MARRASINCAAAAPGVVACHMGRDIAFAASAEKVLGVIGFVGTGTRSSPSRTPAAAGHA
jgi:hypothetical protein